MQVFDYNGEGRWSRAEILARYARYADEAAIPARDLSPQEHSERNRHWVYPVMYRVIEGIEAGDEACIRLGLEFIEEDDKFPFGKILKSNTARALRRASLTEEQQRRIRRRVFAMLQAGHVPHEYHEYARLVRRIGFTAADLPEVDGSNRYVARWQAYFHEALRER